MKKAVFSKTAMVFVVFFMVVVCAFESVKAAEGIICEGAVTDINGNAAGTLWYTIYADGTMVITGRGPGASYRPFGMDFDEKCPWNAYREEIKSVIFQCEMQGTAVPSIGKGPSINGWFVNCRALERVTGIPEGITDMSATFLNCRSLTQVERIPSTVKTLQYTFWDCIALQYAPVLPEGLEDDLVTEFDGHDPQVSQGLLGTFCGCASLVRMPEIPQNPKLYKMTETFKNCTRLKEARVIPENVSYFQATFRECLALRDVLYIKAPKVQLIDGVFHGTAKENEYLLFIKTDTDIAGRAIMDVMDETARIYLWNGEFKVHFMVLNSLDNEKYGVSQRGLNLRYGSCFTNEVSGDYRSYMNNTYGNYYNVEYPGLGNLPTPVASGFTFEGWYLDAGYTQPLTADMLVNPDNRQLVAQEMTLYAKMVYVGDGCILTINPNGGFYEGNNGVTTIRDFQDKSFEVFFDYTGKQQDYIVPISGNYTMELYGAQGGRYEYMFGGWGGTISGMARLEKGSHLYIYVGGGGQRSNHRYAEGGYNGGGNSVEGYITSYYDDDLEEWVTVYDCCGGGGGATDIRLDSMDITARILTAGGGGGAGLHNDWYCRSDRPDKPNIYTDEEDEEFAIYNRTIDGPYGQGGNSAAGGGGGVLGGAHNYTGEDLYGRINSSYSGTNGYNPEIVDCLSSNYFVWGEDDYTEYGKNGYAKIRYSGKGYNPGTPTRDGYQFAGWTIEGDGSILDGTVYMSEGSTMLTANWVPVDYEIYFDGQGGYVPVQSMTYWKGYPYGQFGDFPVAAKVGYHFTGWYTDAIGGESITEGKIADSTGIIILYAHYEARRFMVSFESGNGMEYQPIMVTWGQNYGVLPKPEREGYWFLGWYNEDGEVNSNTKVSLLKDHTLIAEWKQMIPPEIGLSGSSDGWRNTPLPIRLDVWDKSDIGLERVSLNVRDLAGNIRTVMQNNFGKGEVSHWEVEYSIGNPDTGEYEGVTEWTIETVDYYGNSSQIQFVVKLDFTPPIISENGTGSTVEKEYLDSDKILQQATDYLSGVGDLYLIPGSMQKGISREELVVHLTTEPYAVNYDTDRTELKDEAAYVLTAIDRAGNRAQKIVFTKISVNNTIIRTVPVENYG